MEKGKIFYYGSRKYAFDKISDYGCVLAFDYQKNRFVKFRRHLTEEIMSKNNGEIDFEIKRSFDDREKNKREKENLVKKLKYGNEFIGNDGNKYFFIKMNRTRFKFSCRFDPYTHYTAKPSFIKTIL